MSQELIDAIFQKNTKKIEELLAKEETDVNFIGTISNPSTYYNPGKIACTALSAAVQTNNESLVKKLLSRGAKIEPRGLPIPEKTIYTSRLANALIAYMENENPENCNTTIFRLLLNKAEDINPAYGNKHIASKWPIRLMTAMHHENTGMDRQMSKTQKERENQIQEDMFHCELLMLYEAIWRHAISTLDDYFLYTCQQYSKPASRLLNADSMHLYLSNQPYICSINHYLQGNALTSITYEITTKQVECIQEALNHVRTLVNKIYEYKKTNAKNKKATEEEGNKVKNKIEKEINKIMNQVLTGLYDLPESLRESIASDEHSLEDAINELFELLKLKPSQNTILNVTHFRSLLNNSFDLELFHRLFAYMAVNKNSDAMILLGVILFKSNELIEANRGNLKVLFGEEQQLLLTREQRERAILWLADLLELQSNLHDTKKRDVAQSYQNARQYIEEYRNKQEETLSENNQDVLNKHLPSHIAEADPNIVEDEGPINKNRETTEQLLKMNNKQWALSESHQNFFNKNYDPNMIDDQDPTKKRNKNGETTEQLLKIN